MTDLLNTVQAAVEFGLSKSTLEHWRTVRMQCEVCAFTAFAVHFVKCQKSRTPPTHWIDGVYLGCGGRI